MKAHSRDDTADGPPAHLAFRRKLTPSMVTRELWKARHLVWTLTERDFRVKYKQAALGVAWALLTPLAMMVVFTLVFQRVAKYDTGRVPYPLFAYVALVPWSFFSASITSGAASLLTNKSLLNKVYCPREVFPLSSLGSAALGAVLSMSVLAALFVWYGFAPHAEALLTPLLFAIELAFTAGVVLLLSALFVYARDLQHLLPILMQLAVLATPVAYALEEIPKSLRIVYCIVNPLAPVIDGYRKLVLYGEAPDGLLLAIAATASLGWLIGGFVLFKKLERRFADVA